MNETRNGPGSGRCRFEPGAVINPVGMIGGAAARVAIDAGVAFPIAGGPMAFTHKEILHLDDTGAIVSHLSPVTGRSVELKDITGTRNIFAGRDLTCPLIMGVVNVTPDSFSDGGDHADPKKAIVHALSLIDAGTDILDIGGESTRPGAAPVDITEECDRILPVIEAAVAAVWRVELLLKGGKVLVLDALEVLELDAGHQLVRNKHIPAHEIHSGGRGSILDRVNFPLLER